MFRRLTPVVIAIAMMACADLSPSAPNIEPLAGSREPASDWAMPGFAIGQVSGACPFPLDGPSGCEGSDPADVWAVTSDDGGTHCFFLVWSPGVCPPQSALCSDLDLILKDPQGQLLQQSTDEAPDGETICAELSANATYFVTVVAFETHGENQNYTLEVVAAE